MFSYFFSLQRSLHQFLTLNTSRTANDDNDDNKTKPSVIVGTAADDDINELKTSNVTVTVTESQPIVVTEKLFTVDSSTTETSSSGGTDNDFEIVSNESSPIASPTTIMAEHDDNNYGHTDESEETDNFPKNFEQPRSMGDLELKRSRLRWVKQGILFLGFEEILAVLHRKCQNYSIWQHSWHYETLTHAHTHSLPQLRIFMHKYIGPKADTSHSLLRFTLFFTRSSAVEKTQRILTIHFSSSMAVVCGKAILPFAR